MKASIGALLFAAACALVVAAIGNDFYLRALFTICTYYLAASGMNVLLGYAGQKSLGQAGLFAAGAYGAALLTTRYEVDPWVALVAATLIAALAGVLIALPSLRVKGPSLAMVTLAFGVVVEKLVSQDVDDFGGSAGVTGVEPLYIGGRSFSLQDWVWFGIALSLVLHLLLRNLLRGRHGRAFVSLRLDEIAASAVGVSVYRYKVLAFVIAAATCGLAGALVAQQNQYFNSDFISFNLSIFIFLLVMFGGAGSTYGPLLGAVTLSALSAYLARWPWIENFVNGAILLFALYVMPDGMAGAFRWLFARLFPARGAFERNMADESGEAVPPREVAARLGRADEARADAGEPLLSAAGLCKSYGAVRPARNIDLAIRRGEIHALIGPNGAGKTTVLNMLTGIVRSDAGAVSFRGKAISGQPAYRICQAGVARTFQNLKLFDELSVMDNVLLGQHGRMRNRFAASALALPFARREEAKARRKAREIIRFVGLDGRERAPAGALPYGLQRRVELARALATEPYLLLLDEPAAGLNGSEAKELADLLLKIRDQGISILLVEHHMEVVMGISDAVTVLDYGEKIAEGAAAAVRCDPRVVEAYFGSQPIVHARQKAEHDRLGAAARLLPTAVR